MHSDNQLYSLLMDTVDVKRSKG